MEYFEIPISEEKIYRYSLEMPSLLLRLEQEDKLAVGKSSIKEYSNWKLRNYTKPEGEAPILNIQLFDGNKDFGPYYMDVMAIINDFAESYDKKANRVPKSLL